MATKVAVVDVERIRLESNMINVKIKALDNTDEFKEMEQALRSAEARLDDYMAGKGSSDSKNLRTLLDDIDYCKNRLDSRAQEEVAKMYTEMDVSINSIIQQLVAEQGIDLLLQASNTVLFMTDAVNLTDDVLAIHNA